MAYTLKDKIFSFFGVSSKLLDTYKNIGGKGINQRYQESIGQDYDDNVGPLIDYFQDNLQNPVTCLPQFIEFIERQLGSPIVIIDTETFRRKMILLNDKILLIKGTRMSYDILYNMIGVTVDAIVVSDEDSGFDSSYTFDDDVRKFDSSAFCCRHYELILSGSAPQTAELTALLLKIALYLKPIDSEIDAITYN